MIFVIMYVFVCVVFWSYFSPIYTGKSNDYDKEWW